MTPEPTASAQPSAALSTTYRRGRSRVYLLLGVALAILVGVGTFILDRLEQLTKEDLNAQLTALREGVASAVSVWLDTQEQAAAAVAHTPQVRALLSGSNTAPDVEALEEALQFALRTGLFQSFAYATEGEVVVARNSGLRPGSPLPAELREVVESALAGDARTSRPFVGDDGQLHMVVGARVDPGRPGVLLLGIPPAHLDQAVEAARGGESAETYAIGPDGQFLTESRFVPQLRELRLIDADADTVVLNLQARDPGGDLRDGYTTAVKRSDQPLTVAASAALERGEGVDVDGYRDYRGVDVVGAWTWLPDHGFAIVTELDRQEALRPFAVVRRLFLVVLGLLLLAVLIAAAVGLMFQRQASRARAAETQAQKLGQYQLEEKLGEGGMGVVYRARHALLRRPTAVKILSGARADSAGVDRFEREVRRTAELTHPNTIAIYDYGRTEAGILYYAMEYLDGVDLDVAVKRTGSMVEERVIHLLRQAAGALAEAHAAGMVHRDIKPANLYLCQRGGEFDVIKVLDFGLVKSSEDEKLLTAANTVMGTPAYLAPEMATTPYAVTGSADLYSLGAVAYYLLTGQLVFEGETSTTVIMAHIHDEPDPPSKRLGHAVDSVLERTIMQCLAKDPDDRPQDAAALIAALNESPLAGSWTPERAAEWWGEHQPELHDGEEREVEQGALDPLQSTFLRADVRDRRGQPASD